MATDGRGGSIWAWILPPLTLVAVAGACALFGLSTMPIDDASGLAPDQAFNVALPAWITAALALVAAGILFFGRSSYTAYRAGGLLGMCTAIGAAAGGVLNLVGYANSEIWWAANPDAIRQAAALLVVVALGALAVVASEQLWPGWRRPAP
jgi:hypothetical protein